MSLVFPVIFNFGMVVAILYFSSRKAFSQFLINRSNDIRNAIAEAEKLSKEANLQLAKCEADARASEAHAKGLLDDAKTILERVRKTSLEKAKSEAERVRKEASLAGKTELTRARLLLQRELAEKSLQETEDYLISHMSEDDRHGLVNNYVETVGNGHAG